MAYLTDVPPPPSPRQKLSLYKWHLLEELHITHDEFLPVDEYSMQFMLTQHVCFSDRVVKYLTSKTQKHKIKRLDKNELFWDLSFSKNNTVPFFLRKRFWYISEESEGIWRIIAFLKRDLRGRKNQGLRVVRNTQEFRKYISRMVGMVALTQLPFLQSCVSEQNAKITSSVTLSSFLPASWKAS